MSFHDDSHILSQLGILDSNEKSPKRELSTEPSTREKQNFVDVRLAASVSDSDNDDGDDGDDVLFDRNNLLSSSKRQNPSLLRGRADNQTIRFLVLSLLLLTAGLVSTPNALSSCSMIHEVIGCFWICFGILIGCYAVKLIAFRENFMLCLLVFLVTLLISLFLVFNFAVLYAIRGLFIGAMLYGGSIAWFAIWRKEPRRFLVLIMLFSAGGMLAMMSKTTAFQDATTSVADMAAISSRSISDSLTGRFKRDTESNSSAPATNEKTLLPFTNDLNNSTVIENSTEPVNVKKPEVATGSEQKAKSKTEENAEKEKAVEKEQKIEKINEKSDETSVVTSIPITTTTTSTSTSTTTTSTTTTTTTESPTTTTTTTTTTEPPTTTTEVHQVNSIRTERKEDENRLTEPTTTPFPSGCPKKSIFLPGPIQSNEEASSFAMRLFVIFVLIIYGMSYVLCCLPCGTKPDAKIKKLESESTVGLGMRLRVSTAVIQTIVGFLQQSVHFHPLVVSESANDAESQHLTACVSVFLTSILLVILGQKTGSISFVFFSFFVFIFGLIVMLIWNTASYGTSIASSGLFAFWISLFLLIEISLRARSTVQLAYFLIAWVVGRILACLFALESNSSSFATVFLILSTIGLGILLVYSARLLLKAQRLKEILDNSSSPMTFGAASSGGEYISLTAQDVLDDDEFMMEEEDVDRSSMDLDFELQEMGLEPVGVGSRS